MYKFTRMFHNTGLWFNGASWKYSPLVSNNPSSSKFNPFLRKFIKNPKRIWTTIIFISLIIITLIILNTSLRFMFMERMTDGDICLLPPWKPITQLQFPIDVIPGKTIAKIVRDPLTEKQQIDVECDSVYQYHFPSMNRGKSFEDWDQKENGLLEFKEEYVMIKCETESNFLTREPLKSDNNKSPSFNLPDNSILKDKKPLVNDVVLILLDGVSREHFNEEFTRTTEFLKSLSGLTNGTHETHSFNRYNVLGMNSPPNKAFIYSGQSKDYLWENGNKADATWLWDIYERQGFVTMHTDGECGGWWVFPYRDYADGAITSYYRATREKNLPANHQFPHVSICENYALYNKGEFGRTCKLLNGQDKKYDDFTNEGMIIRSPFCMGERSAYDVQFDYLRQFLNVYNDTNENGENYKRLATVTLMDTHDSMLDLIGLDKSMVNLLSELLIGKGDQKPILDENSAVIILSDHGIHYGFEYASYEGYLHHKQPLLHMILPKDISVSQEENQNILTTHADLHMTLLYLAFGKNPNENDLNQINVAQLLKQTGTLFEDDTLTQAQIYGDVLFYPLDEHRSCAKLGIPTEYCPCIKYTELENTNDKDGPVINGLIELAVSFMNDKIQEFKADEICNKFEFDSSKDINSANITNFVYGNVEFFSGYYLPSTSLGSRIYAVTVNVKSYPAKLKFSSTYTNIINKNKDDLTVIQVTTYKEEWEGICRNNIYKDIKNEKQNQESETYLKHFCFCSKQF